MSGCTQLSPRAALGASGVAAGQGPGTSAAEAGAPTASATATAAPATTPECQSRARSRVPRCASACVLAIVRRRISFSGNLFDLHVLWAYELIAEIAQALDSLLEGAERILWAVEEARHAIAYHQRALSIGDDICRQPRRNVVVHGRIEASWLVGEHLGSVDV